MSFNSVYNSGSIEENTPIPGFLPLSETSLKRHNSKQNTSENKDSILSGSWTEGVKEELSHLLSYEEVDISKLLKCFTEKTRAQGVRSIVSLIANQGTSKDQVHMLTLLSKIVDLSECRSDTLLILKDMNNILGDDVSVEKRIEIFESVIQFHEMNIRSWLIHDMLSRLTNSFNSSESRVEFITFLAVLIPKERFHIMDIQYFVSDLMNLLINEDSKEWKEIAVEATSLMDKQTSYQQRTIIVTELLKIPKNIRGHVFYLNTFFTANHTEYRSLETLLAIASVPNNKRRDAVFFAHFFLKVSNNKPSIQEIFNFLSDDSPADIENKRVALKTVQPLFEEIRDITEQNKLIQFISKLSYEEQSIAMQKAQSSEEPFMTDADIAFLFCIAAACGRRENLMDKALFVAKNPNISMQILFQLIEVAPSKRRGYLIQVCALIRSGSIKWNTPGFNKLMNQKLELLRHVVEMDPAIPFEYQIKAVEFLGVFCGQLTEEQFLEKLRSHPDKTVPITAVQLLAKINPEIFLKNYNNFGIQETEKQIETITICIKHTQIEEVRKSTDMVSESFVENLFTHLTSAPFNGNLEIYINNRLEKTLSAIAVFHYICGKKSSKEPVSSKTKNNNSDFQEWIVKHKFINALSHIHSSAHKDMIVYQLKEFDENQELQSLYEKKFDQGSDVQPFKRLTNMQLASLQYVLQKDVGEQIARIQEVINKIEQSDRYRANDDEVLKELNKLKEQKTVLNNRLKEIENSIENLQIILQTIFKENKKAGLLIEVLYFLNLESVPNEIKMMIMEKLSEGLSRKMHLSKKNVLVPDESLKNYQKRITDNKDLLMENLYNLLFIFQFEDEINYLQKESSLQETATHILQKTLDIQENISTKELCEKFETELFHNALITYITSIFSVRNPKLMKNVGRFALSVLKGTFHQERYRTDNNEHLAEVQKIHPKSFAMWKNLSLSREVVLTPEKTSDEFDPKKWFDEKKNHGHVQVLEDSILQKEKETGSQHPIRKTLDNLFNAKTKEDQINALKDLQKALEKFPDCEFKNDVSSQIKNLEPKHSETPIKAVVRITDDPIKIFLCGSRVQESCQRIEGYGKYNQGVVGYLLNGANQMIEVVDDNENLLYRAFLKLSLGDKEHILYLEKSYQGKVCSMAYAEACEKAIVDIARAASDELRLKLAAESSNYTKEIDAGPLNEDLRYLGSDDIVCEYSDANRGIQPNCRYTVAKENCKLLHTVQEIPDTE